MNNDGALRQLILDEIERFDNESGAIETVERIRALVTKAEAEPVTKQPVDEKTGWPIFSVGGADFAVGSVQHIRDGVPGYVQYRRMQGVGPVCHAYSDDPCGSLQHSLWLARATFDRNASR